MRIYLNILLSVLIWLSLFSVKCRNNDKLQADNELINSIGKDKIAKQIKTISYTTKREFDKTVINKPIERGTYQSLVPIHLEWSIAYYDEYNNELLVEELLVTDSIGTTLPFESKFFEYFNPDKKMLSKVITKNALETIIEYYFRNELGNLIEKQKKSPNGELLQKTLIGYNSFGQKNKIEKYIKSGLKEQIIYEYANNLVESKIIKKTIDFFAEKESESYSDTYKYTLSDSGLLLNMKYTKIKQNDLGQKYLASEITHTTGHF